MFSKSIVRTDRFLEMPASARLLYYDLGVEADDDGFVSNPRSVIRATGASDDDIKILGAKGFVRLFSDGVLVILDWEENNYIPKDRYTPSKYQLIHRKEAEELGKCFRDNPAGSRGRRFCIQGVHNLSSNLYTQVRLGKERKEKKLPEQKTPAQELIEFFKSLRGYDGVIGWDEANWKRHVRPANQLLKFSGSLEEAKRATEVISTFLESKGLSWELETIIKKFADYKLGRLGVDGGNYSPEEIESMIKRGILKKESSVKGGERE